MLKHDISTIDFRLYVSYGQRLYVAWLADLLKVHSLNGYVHTRSIHYKELCTPVRTLIGRMHTYGVSNRPPNPRRKTLLSLEKLLLLCILVRPYSCARAALIRTVAWEFYYNSATFCRLLNSYHCFLLVSWEAVNGMLEPLKHILCSWKLKANWIRCISFVCWEQEWMKIDKALTALSNSCQPIAV